MRQKASGGGNLALLDENIKNNFNAKLSQQADLFESWSNNSDFNGSEFEMFHFDKDTYAQDLEEFAGAYVDKFDEDKDGGWNFNEFVKKMLNGTNYSLAKLAEQFNNLDVDGNGLVSKEEYSAHLYATDIADGNMDGKISHSINKKVFDMIGGGNKQPMVFKSIGTSSMLKELKAKYVNENYDGDKGKINYLNTQKETITMGLSILAGNSVNLNIVSALTDGLIEYFSNGSNFTAETVPDLIDRDFKNYLDEKYPDIGYSKEDLNNLKNSLYGLIAETSDGKVDLNAFNTIVKDYETNINNKETNTINLINDFNTKKAGLSYNKLNTNEWIDIRNRMRKEVAVLGTPMMLKLNRVSATDIKPRAQAILNEFNNKLAGKNYSPEDVNELKTKCWYDKLTTLASTAKIEIESQPKPRFLSSYKEYEEANRQLAIQHPEADTDKDGQISWNEKTQYNNTHWDEI